MNISTHLQFGDNVSGSYNIDYPVVGARTHFGRQTNTYHPDSNAKCTFLEVTVIATEKKDTLLQEWFYNNSKVNGRLVYELSEMNASGDEIVKRELIFNDAQCFEFREIFNIRNKFQRVFELKIIARECVMDNIHFTTQPE